MRSGDIGDEAAWSAEEADAPLDLDAVRADDDLIEALAAGLVPPPSGPRDPDDVEGELVALLAGWVADVRPETLLHRPDERPIAVRVSATSSSAAAEGTVGGHGSLSLLEYDELPAPVPLSRWRSQGMRPLLLRAAATLVAFALVGSAVVAGSYDAHPGEPLWLVAKVVFPEKSHSVEAATAVSTALNTARVALERGRVDEAREVIEGVEVQLAAVNEADGRAEVVQQSRYLAAQLSAPSGMTAQQVSMVDRERRTLAMGQAGAVIRSNSTTTPGATQALSNPGGVAGGLAVAAAAPAPGAPAPSAPSPGAGTPGATAPGATAPGVPAPDASAPPAVLAAPGPSEPAASAPPPGIADSGASAPAPASGGGSASPPPAADPPPPVVSPTTAPPDPQSTQSSPPEAPPPTTDPASGGGSGASQDYGPDTTTNGSGSDTSQSSGDPASTSGSASDSGSAGSAGVDISTEGSVGSTLGAVAGVVSSAENTSS